MELSAAVWRKSSYSGTETNCVELAGLESQMAIRDSKAPSDGALVLPRGAVVTLLARLRG